MQTRPKVTTRDRTEAPQSVPESSVDLSLALDAPRSRPPWRVRHARLLFFAGAAVLACLLGTAGFLTWRTLGETPLDEITVRTSPAEKTDLPPSPPPRRATSAGTTTPAAVSAPTSSAKVPKAVGTKPAEPLTPRRVAAGSVTHTRETAEPRGEQPAATPIDRARVDAPPAASRQPTSNCTEAVAALNLCPKIQNGAGR